MDAVVATNNSTFCCSSRENNTLSFKHPQKNPFVRRGLERLDTNIVLLAVKHLLSSLLIKKTYGKYSV